MEWWRLGGVRWLGGVIGWVERDRFDGVQTLGGG